MAVASRQDTCGYSETGGGSEQFADHGALLPSPALRAGHGKGRTGGRRATLIAARAIPGAGSKSFADVLTIVGAKRRLVAGCFRRVGGDRVELGLLFSIGMLDRAIAAA